LFSILTFSGDYLDDDVRDFTIVCADDGLAVATKEVPGKKGGHTPPAWDRAVNATKVVDPGLAWETVGCPLRWIPIVRQPEPRMNIHKNARLTPQGRLLLVERITEAGWSVVQAAQAAGISVRQSYRWLARYRAEGAAGLGDRSSAPHHGSSR